MSDSTKYLLALLAVGAVIAARRRRRPTRSRLLVTTVHLPTGVTMEEAADNIRENVRRLFDEMQGAPR